MWRAAARALSAHRPRVVSVARAAVRAFAANPVRPKVEHRDFIDRIRVHVRGGSGGLGCNSFTNVRNGGKSGTPDGERGGDGGDVWLRATPASASFSFESLHIEAERGTNGGSNHKKGAKGRDAIVAVPAGTIVRRVTGTDPVTGALVVDPQPVVDLDRVGAQFRIARGGRGGQGNCVMLRKTHFKELARVSTAGEAGESAHLQLELKLIADAGLVGYPNAGKSSLLAAVSNATPKIAAYAFTTLHPHIGVVDFKPDVKPDVKPDAAAAPATDAATAASASPSASANGSALTPGAGVGGEANTFSMADLPGLIDGAHADVGLGHEFLKHIERTKVLVYVLDIAGTEQRDPIDDFRSLHNELRLYSEQVIADAAAKRVRGVVAAADLMRRPAVIFCNKTDACVAPATAAAKAPRKRTPTTAAATATATAAADAPEDARVGTDGRSGTRSLPATLTRLRRTLEAVGMADVSIVSGSARTGEGLQELVARIGQLVAAADASAAAFAAAAPAPAASAPVAASTTAASAENSTAALDSDGSSVSAEVPAPAPGAFAQKLVRVSVDAPAPKSKPKIKSKRGVASK